MKYWIMLNGVQLGPMELNEVLALPVDASTPVWCEGLADWTTAGQVPELAEAIGRRGDAQVSQFCDTQHDRRQDYRQQDCRPDYQQPQQQQSFQSGPGFGFPRDVPPMPPTYLALSILATILCCIPFGIVAIVCSCNVTSAYNRGDYDRAQRSSRNAVIWIIVSVVSSLIMGAFYTVMFLGSAMTELM